MGLQSCGVKVYGVILRGIFLLVPGRQFAPNRLGVDRATTARVDSWLIDRGKKLMMGISVLNVDPSYVLLEWHSAIGINIVAE